MANKYLLHGKLTAHAGHRKTLANILMEASELVAKAKGCRLYVISKEDADTNILYVTEIWDCKEDHDNSLKIEAVKALIMKAMPLLAGPPTKRQDLEVLGGAGM